jgi:V8-like Glu-specific endopeptidase
MKKPEDLITRAIRQLPDLQVVEDHLNSQAPKEVLETNFPVEDTSLRTRGMSAAPTTRAIVRARAGFESMDSTNNVNEVATAINNTRERYVDAGKRAIKKIRQDNEKANLTPEESEGLEAIILLIGRPAILIQDDKFFPPPAGWEILEQVRASIEENLQSVGRIEVTGHPAGMNWIGTGFLVAKDVVMTNRHVAKEFCRMKTAATWEFEPGMTARIDYNEQFGSTKSAEFAIKSVIGVHSLYDMALFKVAPKSSGGAKSPKPLSIASKVAKTKEQRKVYVVGYPASDSRRNDPEEMRRIFNNIYDVKRLQPGEVMSIETTKALFSHDCSTLGGNSGSCVIDIESNQVIGLHFSGSYLESNRAVALWKLTKDPLLKKAGVNFV